MRLFKQYPVGATFTRLGDGSPPDPSAFIEVLIQHPPIGEPAPIDAIALPLQASPAAHDSVELIRDAGVIHVGVNELGWVVYEWFPLP